MSIIRINPEAVQIPSNGNGPIIIGGAKSDYLCVPIRGEVIIYYKHEAIWDTADKGMYVGWLMAAQQAIAKHNNEIANSSE